jgi:hypothetical protein
MAMINEIRKEAEPVIQSGKMKIDRISAQVSERMNAVFATEFGDSVARKLAAVFNHNTDQYDAAIDAAYNMAGTGGSQAHHIVDGSHSLLGAFEKACAVFPDDSVYREFVESIEHLARDAMSVSGINPFFQLDAGSFAGMKDWLSANFGVSKGWVNDALTFNGPELLGSAFATLAVLYNWKKADVEDFTRMSSSLGVAAIYSANPLLGVITLISAARAWHRSKNKPVNKREVLKNMADGAVPTSVLIGISAIVGGPVWIGLVLGIIFASRSRAWMNNPSQFARDVAQVFKNAQKITLFSMEQLKRRFQWGS